jgi:hypothetical protein
MTGGDNKQQEHAADGDGSDKEGNHGKGDSDDNEGGGQQRGQGWNGPWRWQQGWHATKMAIVMVARAMATRVEGKQRQQEQWRPRRQTTIN